MRDVKLRVALFAVAALAGCNRTTLVGSLVCRVPSDCAPPDSVCSADGRCVQGCTANPQACIGGSSCDPTTGECSGGVVGSACSDDSNCDPPDLVCRTATGTCVAGCTISPDCASGFVCNPSTGRCCDGSDPSCPRPPDLGTPPCNTDSECVGAPANICSGGACVQGCLSGAPCPSPLACDANTGHCATPSCTRDTDCDPGSYCTQAAMCSVLAFGGPSACAGGTVVYYDCAQKSSPSLFAQCVGPPGPVGCPYCIDYSCLHAGLCASDTDCHRGDACQGGLCRVKAPACPTVAALPSVVGGKFAAGKELCVRGTVTLVRTGYDGMIEVELKPSPSPSPYLFVDVPPMYAAAGVQVPTAGQTVTVHGTVRWDDSHDNFELMPVDFVGP
jgi:hypothetical protein